MNDFNTLLNEIKVASTNSGVNITNQFTNISGGELLRELCSPREGCKDGSHWLRGALKVEATGKCMPRSNENAESLASVLIIDCDCSIDGNGQEIEGAPDPLKVSNILKNNGIGHALYGSYSHYTGEKGNRYRILLITKTPYSKEQLPPTAQKIVSLINTELTKMDVMVLAYAIENHSWSQPWFFPRKPSSSSIEPLYIEYVEGNAVDSIASLQLPLDNHTPHRVKQLGVGELSPIDLFNEQNNLADGLSRYGYKRILITKDYEKWLSPASSSGVAGITVKSNKFYSHHNDIFNDGYWHDAFDLFKVMEGLTEHEAIIKAAQNTKAPNGRTVDEHNKSLGNKQKQSSQSVPSNVSFKEYSPFNDELLPVQYVPYDALPEQMANFIKEQSIIRGCPPDYILVSLLARMGCVFSGKIKIALTRNSGWHASPNFFWVMIGDPSLGKSNALGVTNKPIQTLEALAREVYKKAYREYKAELDSLERQLNSIQKGLDGEIKKANCDYLKVRQFEDRIRAVQQNIYDLEDNKPRRKHYTVNKLTVEKLILILEENPGERSRNNLDIIGLFWANRII